MIIPMSKVKVNENGFAILEVVCLKRKEWIPYGVYTSKSEADKNRKPLLKPVS